MAPKDPIVELIQSLDQSEKRYFKLFASMRAGDKNYIKLYDLIESGITEDKSLRAALAGRNVHLSYEKRYLHRQILRSLANYRYESSDAVFFQNRLVEIELLFEKRLFGQCLELVRQSYKAAHKQELDFIIMQLSRWEGKCLQAMSRYEEAWENAKTNIAAEKERIQAIENFSEYRALQLEIYNLAAKGHGTGQTGFLRHPLLQSPSSARSFLAKLLYYELKALVCQREGDNASCYLLARGALDLFLSDPQRVKQYPRPYLATLSNYFHRCEESGDYNEQEKILALIGSMLETKDLNLSPKLKFDIEAVVYEKRIILFTAQCEYQKACLFYEESIKSPKPKLKELPLVKKVTVSFCVALSYFYTRDYGKSQQILREMIDGYFDVARSDYFVQVQMLQIMVQYETDELELIPYLCKSLQRFATKRKIKARSVSLFITTVTMMIKLKNQPKELKEFAVQRQREFKELFLDNDEVWFNTAQLVNWLDTV